MSTKDDRIEIRPGRVIRVKQDSPDAKAGSRRTSLTRFFSPLKGNILFVHGSCAGLNQYEDLMNAMFPFMKEKSFTSESFDAYGCGGSDKPKDYDAYSEHELHLDLEAIWRKSMHSTTNYIVAHSYGCSQVIKLVGRMSDDEKKSLKGLILLGGTLPGRDGGHPIMVLPSIVLDLLQPMLSNMFRSSAFHPSARQELLDRAYRRSQDNPMYFCKYFYMQSKWATFEDCQKIPCKVLVVHGEDDKILPIEGARTLAAAIPNCEMATIPEASHQVMEEKPQAVAQLIKTFISKT